MKIPFTEETKQAIIKEQKARGWFLVEEQNHNDGNFLVFATQPLANKSPETLESRVTALETEVAALKTKVK